MVKVKLPNFFDQFIHSCLDLIFPRHCLSCKREKTWLCQPCLNSLPRNFSDPDEKIFAVFDYQSPIMKQVIWALKYKQVLELAQTLARPMYETLLEELEYELATKIILIPVPLSSARLRFRGYNQAEELAKQIVALNPKQFELRTEIIKKVKDTPTQVSIRNRSDRLSNLKGAFTLSYRAKLDFEEPISPTSHGSNKIFVVIDDVSTTGSTINEIRKILHQAGLRKVYGLVIAHS